MTVIAPFTKPSFLYIFSSLAEWLACLNVKCERCNNIFSLSLSHTIYTDFLVSSSLFVLLYFPPEKKTKTKRKKKTKKPNMVERYTVRD